VKPRTEPGDCFRLVTLATDMVLVKVLVVYGMCDLVIVLVLRWRVTCAHYGDGCGILRM